jgi:hypothetical protein
VGVGNDTPVGTQSPGTPYEGHEEQNYDGEPGASGAGSATGNIAAVFDVFRKGDPVGVGRITHSALATAFFEAGHPGGFLEAESAKVAANKTSAEDSAGQIAEGAGLKRTDVAYRDFGGGADGLYRDAAPFTLAP